MAGAARRGGASGVPTATGISSGGGSTAGGGTPTRIGRHAPAADLAGVAAALSGGHAGPGSSSTAAGKRPREGGDGGALFGARDGERAGGSEAAPLRVVGGPGGPAGSTGTAPATGTQVQAYRQFIRESDDALDALHVSVTRLGAVSQSIHSELVEQSRIIDDATERIDTVNGTMKRLTRQTNDLVRRNGGWRACGIIGILLVILLVLILIIIFM